MASDREEFMAKFKSKTLNFQPKTPSSKTITIKTPSPPKTNNFIVSQSTTRGQNLKQNSNYSSNTKSQRFGGKTETPDCDRKLKILEKTGLLARLNSMKINKIGDDIDEIDIGQTDKQSQSRLNGQSHNVKTEEKVKTETNGRTMNRIQEMFEVSFQEGQNDYRDHHQGDYHEDFHEDAPSFVREICSEAQKITLFRDHCSNRRLNNIKTSSTASSATTTTTTTTTTTASSISSKQTSSFINHLFQSQKDKPILPECFKPRTLPFWQIEDLVRSQKEKQNKTKAKSSQPSKLSSSQSFKSLSSKSTSASSISSQSQPKVKETQVKRTEKKRLSVSDGEIQAAGDHKAPKLQSNNIPKTKSQPNINDFGSKINVIKVNDKLYQMLNCIGEGGSSKVYQVYDSISQVTLALKIVDLSKADQLTREGYKNEINLLKKLKSCHRVVRMYDFEFRNSENKLFVVMEKGDSDLASVLKSFVETENYKLDPHMIRFYWKEMLKAVDEIHQHGIVHADLKPVNFILISGKLKLIDFGIANAIQHDHTSVFKDHQIGTINYMAPEALKNRSTTGRTVIKFNCKADIWSLGCILYNLVYGLTPFHHFPDLISKAQAILNDRYEIKYPPIDDPLLLDCIKLCLQRDANQRPTAKELLNHGYLTDSNGVQTQSSQEMINNNLIASQSQQFLLSKINNLTPRRIQKLSQVLEQMTNN